MVTYWRAETLLTPDAMHSPGVVGCCILVSGNSRGRPGAMHSRTQPSMISNFEERKSSRGPSRFKCVAPGFKINLKLSLKHHKVKM